MESGHSRPLSATQRNDLERAFGLLSSRRISGAAFIADALVAGQPLAPDAHHLRAICLAESGDIDSANEAFQRALHLAPAHPLVLSNYAAMLRKAGRHAAALDVARQGVGSAPQSAKAWLELGLTAEGANDATQALTAAGEALRLQPGLSAAWELQGRVSRGLEDIETAVAAFDRVVALKPSDRSAWASLGMMQRLAGRSSDAIASLERGIRETGWHPQLADALAGALLDASEPGRAIETARNLVQQCPDFVPGVVTLATLLWEYDSGDAAAAARGVFRHAIAKLPDSEALAVAYVQFLLASGASDEALAQLRLLRQRGDQPWLALLEAQALESGGQKSAAGVIHVALHDSSVGSASAGYLNAYARHLLGDGDAALAASIAGRAILIDPDNQEAWSYLGIAWRLLDDPREFWLCDYERLVALVDVDAPISFEGRDPFLHALEARLESLHLATREPMRQSLRSGSQTPGRLFGRADPLIAATEHVLRQAVERWLSSLPTDDQHPFLRRRQPRVRIGGSWSVRLRSSGNHVNHIHSEGWISSAFYVALPPSVRTSRPAQDAQPGAIQFGQPPLELGLGLAPRRVVIPRPGTLALFPSYMWHGTVPFEDASPRITIAFDMVPLVPKA